MTILNFSEQQKNEIVKAKNNASLWNSAKNYLVEAFNSN